MEKSSLICIVPDSALGCKHLDKIDIKRKEFSALKSERVQKKQKILTAVPLNKDFWCILIEKRKRKIRICITEQEFQLHIITQ